MSARPIMIMAGGTGGHVYPALVVAEALKAREQPVFWLGTRRGLEARVVPEHGIDIEWVAVSGLRGKGFATVLAAPLRLVWALSQSLAIVFRRRPAAVLGMGGFVSGPGGIAAWLTGRPLAIHEQNAVAGLTNRLLARLARVVFEAFPGSFAASRRAVTVGNPVRPAIAALPPPAERYAGRAGPLRLLVLGGSQGALSLNRLVPAALARLPASARPIVRHQCGARTRAIAEAGYADSGIRVELIPFIEDMAAAYAWADLVVCRAGALTVAEVAAAGLPAVFIPYPAALDDHQTANARSLTERGAALTVQERDLDPESLAAIVRDQLADRATLAVRADLARRERYVDTPDEIAARCLRLAAGRRA